MRRTNSMSFFTRVWGHVVHGSGRWRWRKARAQKAGVAAMARARGPLAAAVQLEHHGALQRADGVGLRGLLG